MMVTTKNITEEQYNEDIRPISAYTTAITALLIFLVINFCMFNYIYVISFVGGLVVSVFVWQSDTLPQLQVAEVCTNDLISINFFHTIFRVF